MTENNETLLVTARKHWIAYLPLTLGHGMLFLAMSIAALVAPWGIAHQFIVTFAWLIATSYTWFFVTLYLDRWDVLESQIIAVDQIELFNRSEAHILMSKIQDVKWERSGVLQEFFGYGKLIVQSAGTEQVFTISHVRDVEQTAQIIVDAKNKVVQEQPAAV